MKKIILSALFALVGLCANAQVELTYSAGVTTGAYFQSLASEHNQWIPLTLNLGIGAKWDNGIYVGAGLAPGAAIPVKGDETAFYMPFYAELSYLKGHSYFADVKVGASVISYKGSHVGFFVNVTPVGYSFNDHNSLGLGYSYDGNFKVAGGNGGHGATITYQYTF